MNFLVPSCHHLLLAEFLGLGMRWLDIAAIVAFFVYVTWAGLRGAKHNTDTQQYFLGGKKLPSWAIGLSMVGTSLSSITFLSLPAAAFAADYRTIVPNLMLPIVAVIAAIYLVPLYRRVSTISAFEYLEKRFGIGIRLYAAITFLLMQTVRVCVVLYLVSLPVAYLSGLPVIWVIIIGGIFLAAYTIYGGLEAVVWTDVLQTGILLVGGIVCMAIILLRLPGGVGEVFTIGQTFDKFDMGDTSFGLQEKTLWVMVALGLVNFASQYVGDQGTVQRYLAAASVREARKATLLCAVVSVPIWLMFFFLGTCLFAYYHAFPDAVVAAFASPDEVVPYFINSAVPAGLSGLIIAGCIAAAMSTLDSSINAMSAVTTTDIYKRLIRPKATDRQQLGIAKMVSAAIALLMILGAIGLHFTPRESMVDLGFIATQLFGGCLLGIFLMGFLSRRVDGRSMLIGLGVVIGVNVYFSLQILDLIPAVAQLPIHTFWVRGLLNVILVVVVLLLSLRSPKNTVDRELTVYATSDPDAPQAVPVVTLAP